MLVRALAPQPPLLALVNKIEEPEWTHDAACEYMHEWHLLDAGGAGAGDGCSCPHAFAPAFMGDWTNIYVHRSQVYIYKEVEKSPHYENEITRWDFYGSSGWWNSAWSLLQSIASSSERRKFIAMTSLYLHTLIRAHLG